MGYVRGESLGQKLERKGPMQAPVVRRIIGEVASALHYAHQQGVVHRDIKPDNILIDDESGRAMLTDFGVAKTVASGETLTALGTAVGTPYYMSPEQASGDRKIDGRSDIYSLGVVAYQLLSGRRPFEGESVREVLLQHVTNDPAPIASLVPSLPEDLGRAVTQCMAKEPDERIQSAGLLRDWIAAGGSEVEETPEELELPVEELRYWSITTAGSFGVAAVLPFFGQFPAAGVAATIGTLLGVGIWEKRRQFLRKGRDYWESVCWWTFKQPSWWTTWWPKRWRSTNDLWTRLPEPIKRYKLSSLRYGPPLIALVLSTVSIMKWMVFGGSGTVALTGLGVVGVMVAFAVGVPLRDLLRAHRWLKKQGLGKRDIDRLLGGRWTPGFGSPFWQKPEIQRLLLPATPEHSLPATPPRSPSGYVQAFADNAAKLAGPAHDLAADALATGREILQAIEALDAQIHALARDSDPAELVRLEQKLALFDEAPDSAADGQRKMRTLIEQQLVLARNLGDQLKTVTRRRERLVDLLKTLWLQVANLNAQAADAALDSGEISGKIRVVSDDIKRYLEASEEAMRLAPPA